MRRESGHAIVNIKVASLCWGKTIKVIILNRNTFLGYKKHNWFSFIFPSKYISINTHNYVFVYMTSQSPRSQWKITETVISNGLCTAKYIYLITQRHLGPQNNCSLQIQNQVHKHLNNMISCVFEKSKYIWAIIMFIIINKTKHFTKHIH